MSIDISETAGVRYLHFGSDWIQGAMRIARPYALELEYTREMMLPLLLRPSDWPQRVLIIGLGAASVLKFIWRHRPQAKLTVVEINPAMEAIARQYFKMPDDPARIRLKIADGADYVAASRRRYDLILVDGFDAKARAGKLDTLPFHQAASQRLTADGLYCVNLLSRRRDFSRRLADLREVFGARLLDFPSCDSGNAIALGLAPGAASPAPSFTELKAAAQELKRDTGLNLLPTLIRLTASRHCAGDRLRL